MSYQEKRTIVSIVAGILLLVAYCVYALNKAQSGLARPDDLKFWAGTILIFIGIGIAATIVIQILFHIMLSISVAVQKAIKGEKDETIEKAICSAMVEDEMDKLIELKSSRVAFIISGAGFVSALLTVHFSGSIAALLNISFLSFMVGSLCEGFMNLYYYRRGIRNG